MRNFDEDFYYEINSLWCVLVYFHQPNAIIKEVH